MQRRLSALGPCLAIWLMIPNALGGASPGAAPALPLTGTRVVRVATEQQLQSAMANLSHGDTILLADGVYPLTSSLYVNGHHNVTIRGAEGSTNVILVGKGMDNRSYGQVRFGIWSNSSTTTVAHLTIRDTYDNAIIFNSGAQSPRVYCVRLLNAGSQFIKSNPTDVKAGTGVNHGRVEYCWFEYTGRPPNDHGAGIGYFNGISAHAAKNWTIRGNLFKNLHNPDESAYPWNPAVLFWRHSGNTVTEQNIFINVDRAVAYGLEGDTPYFDHWGGMIRNNFVYLAPGLMSASRRASSDGSIIAWNSPGTQIDHNTLLLNENVSCAIEFRFPNTTKVAARNNLADAPIRLRDRAAAILQTNLANATPDMFVSANTADLHLRPAAAQAIDQASTLMTVTNDFDGEARPQNRRSDIGADEFTAHAAPVITGFKRVGTTSVLNFRSMLGRNYEVQNVNDLEVDDWSVLATSIAGTGSDIEFVDVMATNQWERFYRVKSSPKM